MVQTARGLGAGDALAWSGIIVVGCVEQIEGGFIYVFGFADFGLLAHLQRRKQERILQV